MGKPFNPDCRVVYWDFMMPNIDPRQLKRIMDSMGIKSNDMDALRVVIECADKDIIIEEPHVTAIEAQGSVSFQISGKVKEIGKAKAEINEDDVKMVAEQSGVGDISAARAALEECNGDIAEAILKLKNNGS
jgi:nascent polypeptide-associated complex subunit alpha